MTIFFIMTPLQFLSRIGRRVDDPAVQAAAATAAGDARYIPIAGVPHAAGKIPVGRGDAHLAGRQNPVVGPQTGRTARRNDRGPGLYQDFDIAFANDSKYTFREAGTTTNPVFLDSLVYPLESWRQQPYLLHARRCNFPDTPDAQMFRQIGQSGAHCPRCAERPTAAGAGYIINRVPQHSDNPDRFRKIRILLLNFILEKFKCGVIRLDIAGLWHPFRWSCCTAPFVRIRTISRAPGRRIPPPCKSRIPPPVRR